MKITTARKNQVGTTIQFMLGYYFALPSRLENILVDDKVWVDVIFDLRYREESIEIGDYCIDSEGYRAENVPLLLRRVHFLGRAK